MSITCGTGSVPHSPLGLVGSSANSWLFTATDESKSTANPNWQSKGFLFGNYDLPMNMCVTCCFVTKKSGSKISSLTTSSLLSSCCSLDLCLTQMESPPGPCWSFLEWSSLPCSPGKFIPLFLDSDQVFGSSLPLTILCQPSDESLLLSSECLQAKKKFFIKRMRHCSIRLGLSWGGRVSGDVDFQCQTHKSPGKTGTSW